MMVDPVVLKYKKRRDARLKKRMDEKPDSWITTEKGSHIPLDKNGNSIGGAGGALKGKNFSNAKSSAKAKGSGPKAENERSTQVISGRKYGLAAKERHKHESAILDRIKELSGADGKGPNIDGISKEIEAMPSGTVFELNGTRWFLYDDKRIAVEGKYWMEGYKPKDFAEAIAEDISKGRDVGIELPPAKLNVAAFDYSHDKEESKEFERYFGKRDYSSCSGLMKYLPVHSQMQFGKTTFIKLSNDNGGMWGNVSDSGDFSDAPYSSGLLVSYLKDGLIKNENPPKILKPDK